MSQAPLRAVVAHFEKSWCRRTVSTVPVLARLALIQISQSTTRVMRDRRLYPN